MSPSNPSGSSGSRLPFLKSSRKQRAAPTPPSASDAPSQSQSSFELTPSGHSNAESASPAHTQEFIQPIPPSRLDPVLDVCIDRAISQFLSGINNTHVALHNNESALKSALNVMQLAETHTDHVVRKMLTDLDGKIRTMKEISFADHQSLVTNLRAQLCSVQLLSSCLLWVWHLRIIQTHSSQSTTALSLVDPVPLEETTAKLLLNTTSSLLRQNFSFEGNAARKSQFTPTMRSAVNCRSPIIGQTVNDIRSFLPECMTKAASNITTIPVIIDLILRNTGEMIAFLSASRFDIVLSRLKNRFAYYQGVEEFPELSESRMLEFCCLDRQKLGAVLKEYSSILHVKRTAQAALCVVLRHAIWRFVKNFQQQFLSLEQFGIEGSPEILFDFVCQISENAKRKSFAWPLMSMLLILCPDSVTALAAGDGNKQPGSSKKAQFVEALKKTLKHPKTLELASTAVADLCEAATFAPIDGMSELRSLVADLQSEFRNRLFDLNRIIGNEQFDDQALLGDALTTLLQLDHQNTARLVLPYCLRAASPFTYKIAALRAIEHMCRKQVSAWSPSIAAVSNDIAKSLRDTFMAASPSHVWFSSAARDLAATDLQILSTILKIWQAEPWLAIHNCGNLKLLGAHFTAAARSLHSALPSECEIISILARLNWLLNGGHEAAIRQGSLHTLIALDSIVGAVTQSLHERVLKSFVHHITLAFIRYAIDSDIALVDGFEILRNHIWRHYRDDNTSATIQPEDIEFLATSVEIAIIFGISSCNPQVRCQAVECAIILHNNSHFSMYTPICRSLALVTAFSSSANAQDFRQDGLLQQVLSSLKTPSLGLSAAWEELVRRWHQFDDLKFHRKLENPNIDTSKYRCEFEISKWKALSGAVILGLNHSIASLHDHQNQWGLSELLPSRFLVCSRVSHEQAEVISIALVDHLCSVETEIADTAQGLLQDVIDVSLIEFILRRSEMILLSVRDASTVTNTSHSAKIIFRLTSVLSSLISRFDTSVANVLDTVYRIILEIATSLHKYDLLAQREVKLAVCGTVKSMGTFAGNLTASMPGQARKTLLDLVLCYAEDALLDPDHADVELLVEAVNAITVLYDIAPLSQLQQSSSMEVSERVFCRYIDTLRSITKQSASSERALQSMVECLYSILRNNWHIGYQYINRLGLSADVTFRNVCLKALAEVIRANIEDPIAKEDDVSYAKISQLLIQPDLQLALVAADLCAINNENSCQLEVILTILDQHNLLIAFMKAVIDQEVLVETEQEGTLFRGNSFATRMLTSFSRARGYRWLRITLKDLLQRVYNDASSPPNGLDDEAEHARKTETITTAFLDMICTTWEKLPSEIREICHHIAETVKSRFPDSVLTAVGGWIFLRFINPAIINPSSIDLDLKADNREIRRTLLDVTRLLQGLANNIRLKESRVHQDFMNTNIYPMMRFLKQISDSPDSYTEKTTLDYGSSLLECEKMALVDFICTNVEKIGKSLLSKSHQIDGTTARMNAPTTSLSAEEVWHRLTEITWAQNREEVPASYDTSVNRTTQFTSRTEYTRWKSIIRCGPWSKTGKPVVSICLSEMNIDTLETVPFLDFVTTFISDHCQGEVILFVDATFFSESNKITPDMNVVFARCLSTMPNGYKTKICIFSPNSEFLRYIRILDLQSTDWSCITIINTWDEFTANFATDVLKKESLLLHQRPRHKCCEGWALSHYGIPRLVDLEINDSHLFVNHSSAILFGDVQGQWQDVVAWDAHTIVRPYTSIEYSGIVIEQAGSPSIVLEFPVALGNDIDALVNAGRGRHQSRSAKLRLPLLCDPTTILASCWNIATFNLGVGLEHTRNAAYCLLLATMEQLKVPSAMSSYSFHLHPPASNAILLCSIAEQCGQAAPQIAPDVVLNALMCIRTATSGQMIQYLHAIKPWIQALSSQSFASRTEYTSKQIKITAIVKSLLQLQLDCDETSAVLQSRIWPSIIKSSSLCSTLIKQLLEIAAGIGNKSCLMEKLVSSLVCAPLALDLRGKVLASIRELLMKSQSNLTTLGMQTSSVDALDALVRLDTALGFDGPLTAQRYAPEILYMLCALAGHENSALRSLVQSAFTNLQQSLKSVCRSSANEPAVRANALALSLEKDIDQGVEHFIECAVSIIHTTAPSTDSANAWLTRWMGLITSTCFQMAKPGKIRGLVILSHLIIDEVDIDIVFQVLSILDGALHGEEDLASAALQCLAKLISKSLPNSALCSQSMFWLSLTIMQTSRALFDNASKLFQASLVSIEAIMTENYQTGQSKPFSHVMNAILSVSGMSDSRDEFNGRISSQFNGCFSVALASALIPGLYMAKCRSMIEDTFKKLLRLSSSSTSTKQHLDLENIGYFVALLPSAIDQSNGFSMDELFKLAGIDKVQGSWYYLGNLQLDVDESSSIILLLASMICAHLAVADSNQVKSACLTILCELAELSPCEIAMCYYQIAETLNEFLAGAEGEHLEAAQSLVSHFVRYKDNITMESQTRRQLKALGFGHLMECHELPRYGDHMQNELLDLVKEMIQALYMSVFAN